MRKMWDNSRIKTLRGTFSQSSLTFVLIFSLFSSSQPRRLNRESSYSVESVETSTSVNFGTTLLAKTLKNNQLFDTTPSDSQINFENETHEPVVSIETSIAPSTLATTASNKSGRHFGSRTKSNHVILPALKPRPTSSFISYNPTNYNKIVIRKKNEELTTTTTTTENVISTVPPSHKNPQNNSNLFEKRKLLFGSRTSRPVIINDNNSQEFELPKTTSRTVGVLNNFDTNAQNYLRNIEEDDIFTTTPETLTTSAKNKRVKIKSLVRLPLLNKERPAQTTENLSKLRNEPIEQPPTTFKTFFKTTTPESRSQFTTKKDSAEFFSTTKYPSHTTKKDSEEFFSTPSRSQFTTKKDSAEFLITSTKIPEEENSELPEFHPTYESPPQKSHTTFSPEFKLRDDGVYSFKFTTASSVAPPPLISSRRVFGEEFGVVHESYDDNEDDSDFDDIFTTTQKFVRNNDEMEKNLKTSSTEAPTTTTKNVKSYHAEVYEDPTSTLPNHNNNYEYDYSGQVSSEKSFNDKKEETRENITKLEKKLRSDIENSDNNEHRLESVEKVLEKEVHPIPSPVKVSQVTVTVTVTQKVNDSLPHYHPHDLSSTTEKKSASDSASTSSENREDEWIPNNFLNFFVAPTPALPNLSSSLLSSLKVEMNTNSKKLSSSTTIAYSQNSQLLSSSKSISPTPSSTTDETINSPSSSSIGLIILETTHNSSQKNFSFKVIEETPSVSSTLALESSLITSSKEFKSVFYSTSSHPHFTTSTFSYASSTEYSFHSPENDSSTSGEQYNFHENDNEHDEHEDFHENNHEHENDNEQIYPTPSSTFSYWDSLGVKSSTSIGFNSSLPTVGGDLEGGFSTPEDMQVKLEAKRPTASSSGGSNEISTNDLGHSNTHAHSGEVLGSVSHPSTVSSSAEQVDSIKKRKDGDFHDDSSKGGLIDQEISTISTTSTPKTTTIDKSEDEEVSRENSGSSESYSSNENNGTSGKERMLPPVAVFIQILLDMPAVQFCPSVLSFKQMVLLVYNNENRKNDDKIGINQVVLYSVPDCINNIPKTKETEDERIVSAKSGPIDGSKYELDSFKSSHNKMDKNKTIYEKESSSSGEHSDKLEFSSSLYPVYIYLNDKNGSYDRRLTELFIELWNETKSPQDAFFNKIKKVEMITSGHGVTGHAPVNENSGIIAAITVASIAAISLLLLGVLLLVMRHRQTQNKFAKRCTPVTLDDYSLDNISVLNSFRRKQRKRASQRSYTNAGFDDPSAPSRPLSGSEFSGVVREVGGIYDEFSRIPNVNPTLDDIPPGAESKNRYANVIPMPDTRVLLTFQDEHPHSDYINANFVQGVNGKSKSYIVTQGPLDETIVDFWRMIWEQQVRVIFMITDFSEAGIPKCGEYYPRSETIDCSQLHGDFQITLEKRDITENCIISNLVIKDMERSLRRDVVHLWYHSWPEKGVPDSPKSTVDFLLKSRKYTKEPCPIVVHCSPGTGRSGTLVACDIGIKELDEFGKVDIPLIVKRVRHDRAGSVQTKEQYKHIYDVIHHYISKNSETPLTSSIISTSSTH